MIGAAKPEPRKAAMIKHDTASVYVFRHDPETGWLLGLIKHPLFGVWMQPGGHVEADETPYEAALREAREETGLDGLRFLDLHRPPQPAPTDTSTPMPLPVWIVEHPVPKGDNHVREAHVHIDFKYLALADEATPAAAPDHPFEWFTRDQVGLLETLADVHALSGPLFDHVESLHTVG